jgi:hypothetical protein
MYQLGSHWTDFRAISYRRLLWKSFEKLKIWLKLDKNIGHIMWRPKYFSDFESDVCSSTLQRELIVTFPWEDGYANALQYYFIRTLPILLFHFLYVRSTLLLYRVSQVLRVWRHRDSGKYLSPLTNRIFNPTLVLCPMQDDTITRMHFFVVDLLN